MLIFKGKKSFQFCTPTQKLDNLYYHIRWSKNPGQPPLPRHSEASFLLQKFLTAKVREKLLNKLN
jgi:hypothetical protein